MEQDNAKLIIPPPQPAFGGGGADTAADQTTPTPARKTSWLARQRAFASAHALYAKNDLAAFLNLAHAHKELQSRAVLCRRKEEQLPLLEACAIDQRSDWLRELWADGARPWDGQRADLICAAGASGDLKTIATLLELDPSLLLLRKPSGMGQSDALHYAVRNNNLETVGALLQAVVREATSSDGGTRAGMAQSSWRAAHAMATNRPLGGAGSAERAILAQFAALTQLHEKPREETLNASAGSPAPAGSVEIAADMPEFAKILLEQMKALQGQVTSLQSHIQQQDQAIIDLGGKVQELLDARPMEPPTRPAHTPPLGALGLLGQRFRKSEAPTAAPTSVPKPPR